MATLKQVFRTKITDLLNISHPIISGGMHNVSYAPLAAAVSNAGALGTITALTQANAEALRFEIRSTKALTNKPFAVNLTLLPILLPTDYMSFARVVVEEGITVVETAGHYKGLEPFVKLFKEHNIKIIHKCTQIRHAKTAEKMGVDAISIDGFEAAGHPGEADIGLWVLLAKAQNELNIPYVATGGCATGQQLAAALALGASGMNMGTRFMATVEAPIHENIKKAIINSTENDTQLIMRSYKNTERVFRNKSSEALAKIESEYPGDFDKIRHLVNGKIYKRVFQVTGEIDDGIWSAGCSMGLINDFPTCNELITRLVCDARDANAKVFQMVLAK